MQIPVAMAQFYSGGIALHYTLAVLWMMICLAVMGKAILGHSLMSMNVRLRCSAVEELLLTYIPCHAVTGENSASSLLVVLGSHTAADDC